MLYIQFSTFSFLLITMSQCCQTTDGFVKLLFGPRVAVLCSQDAEIISRRNNLSFAELIRPFCTINNELKVHDPSSTQAYSIRDLHITVCDLRCKPPDEASVEKMLSLVVNEASSSSEIYQTQNIDNERYQMNVNVSCPWFEAFRDTITSLASQKPHEFINHCLSCLLVVSSSHPNPLDEFSKLSQHQNYIQHNSQPSPIRWMTPNTLKYYVLLHDNSNADLEKARSVMNDLQGMYGSGACHLLQINSKLQNDEQQLPDPWSRFVNSRSAFVAKEPNGLTINDLKLPSNLNVDPMTVSTEIQSNAVDWVKELKKVAVIPQKGYGCCLTLSDHDNLRMFLQEFASKGLVPHMEKLIRNFHEQISSRKALHRSIFRVTRTFFGGNKAASAPALKNYGSSGDTPELQMRKIADLFFLCQMYEHAYSYYHSIRKDFSNEQAWLHAAGASEMAAFSNFMQLRAQRSYPGHYVDSAIDTYLSNSGDNYLALRCAFVSLECLRTQGAYTEAIAQLKKLISEENDLQSAICWEQIAQCCLHTKRPNLRKYAFYVLLAGHRYHKAMQYNCALTCYKMAMQIYMGSGWNVAIDFINFTIGRLLFQLQQFGPAALAFERLLKESNQSVSQQAIYVNEYLHVTSFQSRSSKTVPLIPLPVVMESKTILRNTQFSIHSLKGETWEFLEDSLRSVVKLTSNCQFVKKRSDFEAVVNEPLWVDITLHNPLQVALAIRDATLVISTHECDESAKLEYPPIKEFILGEKSQSLISFSLNPRVTGSFNVVGMNYSLSMTRITSFSTHLAMGNIELSGCQKFNAANLTFNVCSPMPKLEVVSDDNAPKMMCGEICSHKILLANVGQISMKNVKVAFDSLKTCLFTNSNQSLMSVRKHFLQVACQLDQEHYCSVQILRDEQLDPGEQCEVTLWLHAPVVEGRKSISLLFYYEGTDSFEGKVKYRSLKYVIDLYTSLSLNLSAYLNEDNSQQGNILTTEIKNCARSESFQCLTVSCTSSSWAIGKVAETKSLDLEAGESAMLYFNITDKLIFKTDVDDYQSIILSDDVPPHEPVPKDDSSTFLKLFYYNKNGKLTSPRLLGHFTLALHWTAGSDDRLITGQHYLHLTELQNNARTLTKIGIHDESGAFDDNNQTLLALHQLVKWNFKVNNCRSHDFLQSSLCFLPVTVVFYNQYDCALRISVNGMDTDVFDSNLAQTIGNQAANTRFLWAGKSLAKFIMQPKGSHSMEMLACFAAPGIYNINTFGVWAVPLKIETKTPLLPQNCNYSCLVTVHDSNSST